MGIDRELLFKAKKYGEDLFNIEIGQELSFDYKEVHRKFRRVE